MQFYQTTGADSFRRLLAGAHGDSARLLTARMSMIQRWTSLVKAHEIVPDSSDQTARAGHRVEGGRQSPRGSYVVSLYHEPPEPASKR